MSNDIDMSELLKAMRRTCMKPLGEYGLDCNCVRCEDEQAVLATRLDEIAHDLDDDCHCGTCNVVKNIANRY